MADTNDRQAILFLCDYQAPYGGNFIASMVRLTDVLTQRDVKALFLFPKGAADRAWCVAMQERNFFLSFFDPASSFSKRLGQLLHLIDQDRVAVLHVHFGCFPLAEAAALLRPKLRLILHFHSDFSAGAKPGFFRRVREKLKAVPEGLIGKKRLTKVTVSETSAMTTKDCVQLHNALVPARFTDELWTREQTRQAWNVPEGATLVLAFGWSPFIKGVDLAARAVAKLQSEGKREFLLGIVCGRTYTPDKMNDFLREKGVCNGTEPWLRLLPPVEDVFRYHKAADVMLSASRSETFSYALLEALYTGKPCVCSDIPGVGWAKRFPTVTYFPTEDADALAQALLAGQAMSKSPYFAHIAAAVTAVIKAEYAIEDWCSGMLALYGITD